MVHAVVYVDCLNLYHGIKAKYGRKYLWLDLFVHCDCDPVREYRTYEEKLTDVALGVAMVKDAAQKYGDLSVLITTDTDLTPAIHAAAERDGRVPLTFEVRGGWLGQPHRAPAGTRTGRWSLTALRRMRSATVEES